MPVSAVVCVSACCQLQTFRGTESVCDSSRPHHLLHASRILRRLLLHLHRTLPRLPARRVSNRPPSSYFVAVISCIWAFSASDTVGWTWWRASGLIKKLSDELLMWLSVWGEVQIVCIWSSWCQCIWKPRHLLHHLNRDLFYLSGCPGKEAVKQV